MSKKYSKTAEELMAELENDPAYLQKRKERDEKFRRLEEKYAELARPILDSLRAKGYGADSIQDLVKKYAPLPAEVVSIMLEHLEPGQEDRHCESLVRALGAAQEPFDGRRLTRCYDATSDESLRWAIANTIALTRPHSISDWIGKTSEQTPLRKTLRDLGYF